MFKKHTLSVMALTGLLTLLSITPAMAASEKVSNSGSAKLTNSEVTPFASASTPIGGGTWNYGTEIIGDQKHVWSTYDHETKTHKASTKLGSASDTSGWIVAGTTATSELWGNKGLTGYAYWNTQN